MNYEYAVTFMVDKNLITTVTVKGRADEDLTEIIKRAREVLRNTQEGDYIATEIERGGWWL